MIATATIIDALEATLAGLTDGGAPLLAKVVVDRSTDFPDALETLRSAPGTLAVIIPGEDEIEHRFAADYGNVPVMAEISSKATVFLATRLMDMRRGGDPASLPLKDAVLAALMWDSLGVSGLVCLPALMEPVAIVSEDGRTRGRDAWKLELVLRQTITL